MSTGNSRFCAILLLCLLNSKEIVCPKDTTQADSTTGQGQGAQPPGTQWFIDQRTQRLYQTIVPSSQYLPSGPASSGQGQSYSQPSAPGMSQRSHPYSQSSISVPGMSGLRQPSAPGIPGQPSATSLPGQGYAYGQSLSTGYSTRPITYGHQLQTGMPMQHVPRGLPMSTSMHRQPQPHFGQPVQKAPVSTFSLNEIIDLSSDEDEPQPTPTMQPVRQPQLVAPMHYQPQQPPQMTGLMGQTMHQQQTYVPPQQTGQSGSAFGHGTGSAAFDSTTGQFVPVGQMLSGFTQQAGVPGMSQGYPTSYQGVQSMGSPGVSGMSQAYPTSYPGVQSMGSPGTRHRSFSTASRDDESFGSPGTRRPSFSTTSRDDESLGTSGARRPSFSTTSRDDESLGTSGTRRQSMSTTSRDDESFGTGGERSRTGSMSSSDEESMQSREGSLARRESSFQPDEKYIQLLSGVKIKMEESEADRMRAKRARDALGKTPVLVYVYKGDLPPQLRD